MARPSAPAAGPGQEHQVHALEGDLGEPTPLSSRPPFRSLVLCFKSEMPSSPGGIPGCSKQTKALALMEREAQASAGCQHLSRPPPCMTLQLCPV